LIKGSPDRFQSKVAHDTQPPKPEKPPRPAPVTAEPKQTTATGPSAAPKPAAKATPDSALAQALAKAKAKLTGSSGGPDTES
jgi:hypothetical protein